MTVPNAIRPFSISAFVVRKDPEHRNFLLLQCSSKPLRGDWQIVSGDCEDAEKVWLTALREVRQQTGLMANELYSADFIEFFYDSTQDVIKHVPVFVAVVDAKKTVRVSPKKHDAFEWLTYADARSRLAFECQKKAIDHVQKKFVDREPNQRFRIEAK